MRHFEFVTLGSGPVADPGPAGQIISRITWEYLIVPPEEPVYTEAHEKFRRKKCREREF